MRSLAMGIFLVILSTNAHADVSLKNGNFFIGYVDALFSGGLEPKIERVYNSKSIYKGMFGWGWGTELEVFLQPMPDGSVIAHEFGGGAENRFFPTHTTAKDVDAQVNLIVSSVAKRGKIPSGYKEKLKNDLAFRDSEWIRMSQAGIVPKVAVQAGIQLKSNRFNFQFITKTKEGYTRVLESGRTEQFDELGRLVKISDKNANWIAFSHGKDGNLSEMKDQLGRWLRFTFNPQKFVQSVTTSEKTTATYGYNALGELVTSKDVDGNNYTYKYSSDNRHNLVEIAYPPSKEKMQITYYGKEQLESVKSVKERDGSLSEYSYFGDRERKNNFGVKVVSKDEKGSLITTSQYEYFVKYKPSGEEWTEKMITTIDGDRTETVYHPDFGLPVAIKKGNDETKFKYDDKGHVTEKETPFQITKLVYDSSSFKVARVSKYSKELKKEVNWSEFEYEKGTANLISAKNSDKKAVKLTYDGQSRIATMIDQGGRRLEFKYNSQSRPIEINDPKMGALKIVYAANGEVKNYESTGGRKVAMEVTSAFQNLLEMVKPAGVTLSF